MGATATASSTVALTAIGRPRRSLPSAVTTQTTSASTSREAMACAEKPEKIGTETAPRCAMA